MGIIAGKPVGILEIDMAELTPKATRKLAALLQAGQDAEAATLALRGKRQKLEEALELAESRAASAPEAGWLQQEAEDLRRELDALEGEQARRLDRHRDAMAVYNHCLEYARLLPYRAELIDIAPPPADGDLAATRATISKAKEAIALLSRAVPMADETAAAVKAYVERTGAQYRPRLTLTTGGGPMADFAWVDMVSPFGAFGMMCWLAPDLVVKRLTAEFAALFGAGTVSAEQRAEWRRQFTEGIDALERVEEALVEAALEAGQDAPRRHDASPAAVLGVTVANMAVAA
jgi:hypothetical protein